MLGSAWLAGLDENGHGLPTLAGQPMPFTSLEA